MIIPLKFNPTLCVQLGDPQQLPPTVISREAQEKGYANSMMYRLMIDYAQPYEMLTVQYRMHHAICEWISHQFYESKLVTAESIYARPCLLNNHTHLPVAFKKQSLFFNIASGYEERFGNEHSASIKNVNEANAIVNVACYLMFSAHFEAKQIGIISFYAAQIVLIKECLKIELHRKKLPVNRHLETPARKYRRRLPRRRKIDYARFLRTHASFCGISCGRKKAKRWIFTCTTRALGVWIFRST